MFKGVALLLFLAFGFLCCEGQTVIPAAGSALSTLRFGLHEGSRGQRILFGEEISSKLSKDFTFEAWIAIKDPFDFQFKSIVSRFRGPLEVAPPPGVVHTNGFTDFNLQVQRGGNLNLFMGGGFRVGVDANRYLFDSLAPYGILIYGGPVPKDTWTHVAFTVETPAGATNPSVVILYANGEEVGRSTWSNTGPIRQDLSATHPIELGHYVNPDEQWWPGWMDEVRFWSRARTGEEIKRDLKVVLSGTEPGLEGYYRFNEPIFGLGNGGLLFPEGRIGTDRRSRAGILGDNPEWTNSGVQALLVGPRYVFVGRFNKLDLWGTDQDQRFLECECDRVIVTLPGKGELFLAPGSAPLEVGSVIPGNAFDTPILYRPFDDENIGGVAGVSDFFEYRTVATKAGADFVSEPAVFLLLILNEDDCGPVGSGFEADCCGVCGGSNDTCICLDGDGLYYGIYDKNMLDKIVTLYEIELTMATLNELDEELRRTAELIESGAEFTDLLADDVFGALDSFNEECLEECCVAIDVIFEEFEIEFPATI
eukprot:TRINITY_DN3436_c0_g1_i1.p1 TRINITY_DN3436_c0_g1~~TRINITY_DN3436_c0_g1_i1.p1  ORF type:complete len:537 (+),score=72.89 TRINITY_DN3436_c0_g1_i1:48-1658(+)